MSPEEFSQEGAPKSALEAHPGAFVVVEVGGKGGPGRADESLLNQFEFPEGEKAYYYNLERNERHLAIPAKDGAPPHESRQVDLTDASFLENDYFKGSADRFVVFNVLSIAGVRLEPYKDGTAPSEAEAAAHMVRAYEIILKKIGESLKAEGKAFIGEWITPDILPELRSIDFAALGLKAEFVTCRNRQDESARARLRELFADLRISRRKQADLLIQFDKSMQEGETPFLLVLSRAA